MAVLNGKSGFKEQATLIRKLDPAIAMNDSWSILTAAVGQKQLATMQKSLDQLERNMKLLLANSEDRLAGDVQGRNGYMMIVNERMQQRGISVSGPEDIQVENAFKETLQDITTLHNQQEGIVSVIEQLKEREILRGFKDAKYMTVLEESIQKFNQTQKIIEMNFRFLKDYYEPYLLRFRGYDQYELTQSAFNPVEQTNEQLIERISNKLKGLEDNYKVMIGFNRDNYKKSSILKAKKLIPAPLDTTNAALVEIPDTMIIGEETGGKMYAYIPEPKN
ncbi:hypothetical protein [Sporosarcina trichiuri]|uniref:hypothetical protein n=1 Tax=Sporosarcina trichiuri TaxID=3056445 RepID=UPI0025B385A7|nr:hypothetical protein [Sporosarcina sp. 0.2-SM1T-5]WJY26380.1 hypothetical protein QWT68_09815 [Sporosarcina sp. 0.2-SM1T-5]